MQKCKKKIRRRIFWMKLNCFLGHISQNISFEQAGKRKMKKKAFGYLIDAFNAKMSIWETYSFFSDETEPTL
jgi:hypothetical protein